MNEKKIKGIVVDAGHGGNDPGAIGNGLKEKDLTLQAAKYMYDRLKELGIPTTLTRDIDETLERDERVSRILDAYGNDPNVILVSNHINAGGGEGAEVVYALRNDDTLATAILDNIGEAGQKKRKVYQRRLPEDPSKDYYYIQRLTGNVEPVLVEYGFIDNIADSNKLKNNLLDYVEGAVKALAEYAGYTYYPPGQNEDLPDATNTYTVQKGDSLYSIARKYDITVNTLKRLNNLTTDTIVIGQILKVPSNEDTPNNNTYIVQKGDTLYSIAKKYGISVDELKRYNDLFSNELLIGQILNIPSDNNNDIEEDEVFYYTVQKGDSLYSIAKRFGINVNDLIKTNGLLNTTLQIGDQLIIPGVTKQNTYTVVSGDSLYSIAKKFNTTVDELKRLNDLTSNLLKIGQILKIK